MSRHAHEQKPVGISPQFSTMNSCPSWNFVHFSNFFPVMGFFGIASSKIVLGSILFRTVILTFVTFHNSTSSSYLEYVELTYYFFRRIYSIRFSNF